MPKFRFLQPRRRLIGQTPGLLRACEEGRGDTVTALCAGNGRWSKMRRLRRFWRCRSVCLASAQSVLSAYTFKQFHSGGSEDIELSNIRGTCSRPCINHFGADVFTKGGGATARLHH
jgi:hypothetical protein